MKLKLAIQKDGREGDVLTIEKFPAVFGRSSNCTYTILEGGISRQHFSIKKEKGHFLLQDMQSTNGTSVSGKEAIAEISLQEGDLIEAGACTFRVLLESPQRKKSAFDGYQTSIIIRDPRKLDKQTAKVMETPVPEISDPGDTWVLEGTKDKLLHSHRALRTLYIILEECTKEPEPARYVERLLKSLCQSIGAQRGAIVFKQSAGGNYIKTYSIEPCEIPLPGALLKEVIEKKRSIISRNPREDSRYSYLQSDWVKHVKSLICAPLISQKKVLGGIYLDRLTGENGSFTEENLELLKAIGLQVGSYIEKSMLLAEVTRVNSQLNNTNQNLQKALVELKKTQKQMIQQERMRALGEMASGIAHDFNNALTAIIGYAELLLLSPEILEDTKEVEDTLGLMRIAAKDAENIVGRLREFYRDRQDESFTGLNLNHIVEKAVLLTQPKWRDQARAKNINISVETNLQKVPKITGNKASLRQMLINLIFNAVDAMPTGGTINIFTYAEDKDVLLEIKDTGIGMSETVRIRCMDPFFSTKKERGTGLGLSMVYGIVQRHGGSILVNSEENKGATFTIRFHVPEKWKPEQNSLDSIHTTVTAALHVLFVDDDAAVRDVVKKYLLKDGHSVEMATNGVEGLQKFFNGKYDLVITDQAMPEMSGEHMSASIKQIAPGIPIILLTGFGDMMEVTRKKPKCVDLILKKPCSIEALRDGIASMFKSKKT